MNTIKEVIDNYKYQNDSLETGFKSIDEEFRIYLSEITTIAARPGIGRDIFAFNILSNIANNDTSVAIIGTDYKRNYVLENLVAINSNYSFHDLYDKDLKSDVDLVYTLKKLESKPIYIEDVLGDYFKIIDSIKRLKEKDNNLKVVLLDHCLESDLIKYKKLSKELNIAIIILVTLPREVEDRDDKCPLLTDLSDDIVKYSDNILLLYREDYYSKNYPIDGKSLLQIFLSKSSNYNYTVMYLLYDRKRKKIENMEKEEIDKYIYNYKILNENIKEEDIKIQYNDYKDNYYTLLEDGTLYYNDTLYDKNIDTLWCYAPELYVATISKDNIVKCINNDILNKYINNNGDKYKYILVSENYLACITQDNKLKVLTNFESNFGVDIESFTDIEDVYTKELIDKDIDKVIGESLYVLKNGKERQVFLTQIDNTLICEKQ